MTGGRLRGLLLAAGGETDKALGALRRALAEHERVPMPFERARTLLALGRVARRSKAKRVAREALDEALAAFEGMGASIWAANARAELGRIAGRPPSDGRLTPTERRAAELLAEGRPSKEVGAVLFVTPQTIETYASRIYAKLGIHSRAALARRLAESDHDTNAKVQGFADFLPPPGGPSVWSMASYLVETYSPIDRDELVAAVSRIQAVAKVMSRQGVPVRHVKAILVPGDETCFHLVDAPSLAAVDELTRRARLINTRVSEAVE